jgi:hypothetical protein
MALKFLGAEDLGARTVACSVCGRKGVRIVFVFEDLDKDAELRIGAECGAKTDPEVPYARLTKALETRASKRERWLLRDWKLSRKGDVHLAVGSRHVLVSQVASHWTFNLDGAEPSDPFKTEELAKLGAFDALYPPPKLGRRGRRA